MRLSPPQLAPGERATVVAAFLTLAVMMVSHQLVETARDALFLASIPARHLPWVYLIVAALAVFVVEVQRRFDKRAGLVPPLLLAAAGHVVFWAYLPSMGETGLYALYVWSGVLTTSLLVQFWTRVSRQFTLTDAKRVYSFIAGGGVLGAVVGSGFAALAATLVEPVQLLLGAAVAMALAAPVAWRLPRPADQGTPQAHRERNAAASVGRFTPFHRPYVRHVAAVVFLASAVFTVVDWLFKSAVAANVPPEQLATFFASFYLLINLAALGTQFFAVNRWIRTAGITTSLAVLPSLLVLGSVGMAVGGGLVAAVGMKVADGTLRHTLHKTSVELLYLPMPERVRVQVKGFIDAFGHRGGQALASLVVLGALAVGISIPWVAASSGLVLVVLVVGLRTPYLNVFRTTLNELLVDVRPGVSTLDVGSIETLVSTLNSPEDHEVLASLAVLERHQKAHLVPALLLYHPSNEVVSTALQLFARVGRTDFIPIADRLLGTATPTIHAAIVRARTHVAPDPEFLASHLDSFCIATRATTAVLGVGLGALDADSARSRIQVILDSDNVQGRFALALAAHDGHGPFIPWLIEHLADDDNPKVRNDALDAMTGHPEARYVPILLNAVLDLSTRETALRVIKAYGTIALPNIERLIVDNNTPNPLRWEFPRILSDMPPAQCLPVLEANLDGQVNGTLEYAIIRAMERVLRRTGVVPTRSVIDRVLRATVQHMMVLIDHHQNLMAGLPDVDPDPVLHHMLMQLCLDKVRNARERTVRLLGLWAHDEDFGRILRGLASDDGSLRSSAIELIEAVAPSDIKPTLVELLVSRDERRVLATASATDLFAPTRRSYDATLQALTEFDSEILRLLAEARAKSLREDAA